ncbi:MAG TPA: phosphatase PAP2 family protein [Solirubrobacteraceae bacterium]|nr:phosphatase PAP2 family protein [Solirubrobacteraceae bacterium]
MPGLWRPLVVAVVCLAALVLVWLAADQSAAVKWKDAVALHDLTRLNRPAIESVGSFLLHLLEPLLFVMWGTALVLTALARGRARLALAVAAVLALAPWSAEKLKPALALPHDAVGGTYLGRASWPSGHATAATVLVLCAVLVAPAGAWRRAAIALGLSYAAAVGFSMVVLAWHMPSDVLGGYLLGTLWAALAVLAVRLWDRLAPDAAPAQSAPAA